MEPKKYSIKLGTARRECASDVEGLESRISICASRFQNSRLSDLTVTLFTALSCTWTQRSEVLSWIGANTYAEATEARNSDPKFALKLDLNSALKLLSSVELSKGKYNSLASIFVYEEESPGTLHSTREIAKHWRGTILAPQV